MEKRKVIALITACPEEEYQQRVMKGVFEQCEKYGYNLAVFAMNVRTNHYFIDYLEGDENIYNLINYEKFDGVIVATINLAHNNTSTLARRVFDKINLTYSGKVVSLDYPFDDVDVVYTDDRLAFKNITNHLIKTHGCRDIHFLTGHNSVEGSHIRVQGYKDSLAENGIPFDPSRITFGNFWYDSGENLAADIISGNVKRPDAVVCANDHMAIGLTNALIAGGISVPEDIMVTGFDSIREAYINDVSVTTYIPDIYNAGARAVNKIHMAIEPDIPLQPISEQKHCLVLGESCGCKSTVRDLKQSLKGAVIHMNQGVRILDKNDPYDLMRLNESYMFETLISQYTSDQVLEKIEENTYLIQPFLDFYLVLRENYLDIGESCQKGYPDRMKMFIHRNDEHGMDGREFSCFSGDDKLGPRSFDTELMLPEMFEPSEKPSVFYFSPVHFNRETFGYAVLRCDLLEEHRIGSVYRGWINNIGNAIELIRVKEKLQDDSFEDKLTGLLNRRGMEFRLKELRYKNDKKQMFVVMVDMDRLKYINDNFGHDEGDYGIMLIAQAMKECASKDYLCVRSGGDEFLILGFGDDCETDVKAMIENIRALIVQKSKACGKLYEISASFGYVIRDVKDVASYNALIKKADEQMYIEKRKKHAERT